MCCNISLAGGLAGGFLGCEHWRQIGGHRLEDRWSPIDCSGSQSEVPEFLGSLRPLQGLCTGILLRFWLFYSKSFMTVLQSFAEVTCVWLKQRMQHRRGSSCLLFSQMLKTFCKIVKQYFSSLFFFWGGGNAVIFRNIIIYGTCDEFIIGRWFLKIQFYWF